MGFVFFALGGRVFLVGILLVGFLKVVVGEIYGVSRDGDWRSYIRKAI